MRCATEHSRNTGRFHNNSVICAWRRKWHLSEIAMGLFQIPGEFLRA